ncbi:MAG: hypothetical protein EBS73_17335 [Betaproteobacteria bacterium]|nr:hypothetical protein [Betaproteobacteria bacterium]
MQVGDRVRFPNKDIGTVVKMDGDDLVVIISQTPWPFPRWVHCTRQSVKLVRTSKKDQLNDMEEALF